MWTSSWGNDDVTETKIPFVLSAAGGFWMEDLRREWGGAGQRWEALEGRGSLCPREGTQVGRAEEELEPLDRDSKTQWRVGSVHQGCQVGLFEAKFDKFDLFFKQLASKFIK